MKPKLHLNFSYWESFLLDDIKWNFIHSKAFKYLINYNQSNTRDYRVLLKDDYIDLDDMEKEYTKEVDATGYSQWESQTFTFNFRSDIESDSEALEELTYLDDLQYYFTASDFFIDWYIEVERIIEGKVWANKEKLESFCIAKYDWILEEKDVDYFLSENWLDRDSYELVYDLDNIIY